MEMKRLSMWFNVVWEMCMAELGPDLSKDGALQIAAPWLNLLTYVIV